MIEVGNVSKFNELMISTKDLIVIVFTSIWNKSCYKFNIEMEKLENKYKDIKILSVDINDTPQITKEYDINIVPTTVFYKDNNKACNDIIGDNKIDEIEHIIKKNI
jgi:thiol-disulfide isomerase/thioredoxin